MALTGTDLALLTARFGCARFGASRFGFIPCPEDVHGAGFDEPGEYIWTEVKPPTTSWTLQTEDCVCGQRPVAAFSNILCNAVGPVAFTDTSTPADQITFWYWDFGDGGTSNLQNPTHIYAEGYFAVTLTVSSDIGSATATGYVSVMSLSAGAAPNPVDTGVDVTFTPTLTGGLAPYTYFWDMDEGSVLLNGLRVGLVGEWLLSEATGTRAARNGAGLDLLESGAIGTSDSGVLFVSTDLRNLRGGNVPTDWTQGGTFAFWTKNDATLVRGIQVMISAGPFGFWTGNALQATMGWAGSGGSYETLTRNSALSWSPGGVSAWVFVCGWCDPADNKLYLRVESWTTGDVASGASLHGQYDGTVMLPTIGGNWDGTKYYDGIMKGLRIWNRVLTSQERDLVFSEGRNLVLPFSTQEIPVYAYATDGAKVASVTVTASTGCTATDTVDVTVNASTLAVTFTMDPDPTQIAVDKDTPITFTPTVTPGIAPYTYDWDWGDGEAHSVTEIPTHTYDGNPLGGTYTVVLTVTDATLATAIDSQTIDIAGA